MLSLSIYRYIVSIQLVEYGFISELFCRNFYVRSKLDKFPSYYRKFRIFIKIVGVLDYERWFIYNLHINFKIFVIGTFN